MKRSTHLIVDSVLLEKAEALGIDMSTTLESALREALAKRETQRWQREHKSEIEAYNDWVARNGLPLEAHRQF